MQRSERILDILMILTLLPIGACNRTGEQSAAVRVKIKLDSTEVVMARFFHTYSGYGRIEAEQLTDLIARFSGTISFNLANGPHYHKGDLIFTLSGKDIRQKRQELLTQREVAQANLVFAEKSYHRKQRLKREKYASAAELEDLRRAYESALQEVAYADSAFEYFLNMTQYRAPFDGTLAGIAVSQGEYVEKGNLIARFLSTCGVKLVGQYFGQVADLEKGGSIGVTLNDSLQTAGSLEYLEQTVDRESGGHTFWIRLDSPKLGLRAGMLVEFVLRYAPYRAPAVPDSALVRDRGRLYVVAVRNGEYRNVAVKIGRRQGELVELIEGPPCSTRVLTRGVFEIFHANLRQSMLIPD